MARIQTVVDECLTVANSSIDISSSTYNEIAAVNWEEQDKNYPQYLFDKKSLEIAVSKFSRTKLPSRYTYNQTMYFFDTFDESEKSTKPLQQKQDELMVIAEQYFAELKGRNDSGRNGFYVNTWSLVPDDEQHNDRLIQLRFSVELQVQRENCDLGTFNYAGVEQPTSFSVTGSTSSAISLGWNDNATAETNYEVWRSSDGCSFSLLNTIAANSTSYTDSGLGSGEGYSYKVRAINASANGKFSDQAIGCTTTGGLTPSGIAYKRPIETGQIVSYRTGDDGYNFINGIYDYVAPIYPASYARLDILAIERFTTLVSANAFGNFDRFTDENGLQVYADNYVIDHYTGLGWYIVFNATLVDWNTAIDNCNSSTQNGFTDWRLPSINEWYSIFRYDSNTSVSNALAYAPFNVTSTGRKASSTTSPRDTAEIMFFQTIPSSDNDKVSAIYEYFQVRNHYT